MNIMLKKYDISWLLLFYISFKNTSDIQFPV